MNTQRERITHTKYSVWPFSEILVKQWLPYLDMNVEIQDQLLDEAVCISQRTDTNGKGMNPVVLSPSMRKY